MSFLDNTLSTLNVLDNAVSNVQDIVFPNKNTTDTRRRFDIDTAEWNIPKLNYNFYVLFYVNDFATIYNATQGTTVLESNPQAISRSYNLEYGTEQNPTPQKYVTQNVVNTASDYNDYNVGLFHKFDSSNPKVKTSYYTDCIANLADAQGYADDMSKWVINCTRPSWNTTFEEYNQYNRKRLVPKKTSYKPIVMNVWDDVKSHVARLLTYQLAIQDNSFFNKTQADFREFTQLDRFMSNWNEWGLNVYSGVSIFEMIQLVEIYGSRVTTYTIHNPKITQVSMSQHDVSGTSAGMGFEITFDYEGFTISNPASSEAYEPLMGGKITKELAAKCRMQYKSKSDLILSGATNILDNLVNGKSIKNNLLDLGSSLGYTSTINALRNVSNVSNLIIPTNDKDKLSTQILKAAGGAAILSGQMFVDSLSQFKG